MKITFCNVCVCSLTMQSKVTVIQNNFAFNTAIASTFASSPSAYWPLSPGGNAIAINKYIISYVNHRQWRNKCRNWNNLPGIHEILFEPTTTSQRVNCLKTNICTHTKCHFAAQMLWDNISFPLCFMAAISMWTFHNTRQHFRLPNHTIRTHSNYVSSVNCTYKAVITAT